MTNSTISVGTPVAVESSMKRMLKKLEKVNAKQGDLSTYSYSKNANGEFVAVSTLTAADKEIMEAKCSEKGHQIHKDGYCVRCHQEL